MWSVKGSDEVVERFKHVPKALKRVHSMTEAFSINDLDWGTIRTTAPITELKIADPETFLTRAQT